MLKTVVKDLNVARRRQFENFGARVNNYGVNFAVCNSDGELVIFSEADGFESESKRLIELSRQALKQAKEDNGIVKGQFFQLGNDGNILATVLQSSDEIAGIALIEVGESAIDKRLLGEMLGILSEDFEAVSKSEEQIELVGTELAQVYEELVILHKLSTNMKVTESDFNYLQMACDSLTEIVGVEGIAILLEKSREDNTEMILAAGWGVIDINGQMAEVLPRRLREELNNGKEALLDSEVDRPFKYKWSESIKNIIAVPLCGKGKAADSTSERPSNDNHIIGMMVAINRVGKQDFDSIDVKLFNSVANGCAVFVENGNLFKDLKELFIGSLKALTSSIDAKDPYTRGHSERVAFISKWIAERLEGELKLSQEQIHRIYLAGLLHDIGKIGINEAVLSKEGKLTEKEFSHIKTHPSIGAGILSGIKQMVDIVPGVLCHHERVDGKGYPNGLVGERIPLIGKIVGLADSFDAMTSKRTYRSAMTVKEALAEVEKELGSQFDEKVGRAFLSSDVSYLWDIMQNGFTGSYETSSFLEYGTVAVGALIK